MSWVGKEARIGALHSKLRYNNEQISSPGGDKNFLFSMSSRPALGSTKPPIKRVTGALSPGLKRQGHEADHSPRTSAKVNKMWMYTSTPTYEFMA
jgi:hypothetical protein